MTSPNLPQTVAAHLDALLVSAKRAPLKATHEAMSAHYREGGHTREAVGDASAALAYAVARMPATYAACVRVFDLVAQRLGGWAPASLLDLGSGPGTAALAASVVWSEVSGAVLVEPNTELQAMARRLIAETPIGSTSHVAYDIARLPAVGPVDLVTLSYVLAEQPVEAVSGLVKRIVGAAGRLVVIVEPGTPAGYARVIEARSALIAAGFGILAPCPHDRACPLSGGDWCHFAVRLSRSAAHMQLKDAHVPFEDEKFSFVAAVRKGGLVPAEARLLAQPHVEKGFVDLKLCTVQGPEQRRIKRRDASAYKAAKSLGWGDEVGPHARLAEPDAS